MGSKALFCFRFGSEGGGRSRFSGRRNLLFRAAANGLLAGLCCLFFAGNGIAGTTQQEVQQLLDRLAKSNCSFYRNGSYHSADEARAHLQRKLDYMARRGLFQTTEQFIERGASRSSFSGKPYRVRCGESEELSRVFLLRLLKEIRSQEPENDP